MLYIIMCRLMNTDMTSTGLTALAQMAPVNQTLEILRYILYVHLLIRSEYVFIILYFTRLDRNKLKADNCHLVATIIEKSSSLTLIE